MGHLSIFSKNPQNLFEAQIRPHLRMLYKQAYRLTGHPQDAEDLVQETVLTLFRKQADLSTLENPHTWLIKTLYHQFVDHYRKAQRSPLTHAEFDQETLEHIEEPTAGPEKAVNLEQVRRKLHKALLCLNAEQRILVSLHDMEGYTLSELEKMLETPIGTLKSRLHRARQAMRDEIFLEPFSGSHRVTG